MTRSYRHGVRALALAATLVLPACQTTEPTDTAAPAAVGDEAEVDGQMPAPDGDAASAVLTIDAVTPTGASITLADYAGTPVFVETFATWCSTCRKQLEDTQRAAAEAGDDAVFLALSVEDSLDPAALATYAEANGFSDLTFAVLSPTAQQTLRDTFGREVLTAPATPKFTVAADGTVSNLTTGFESVEEILAQLA